MEKETNSFKLGLFITIGIALIVISIYFIGKQQNMFQRTFTANAIFKDIKGLQVGNNVQFSGINVGTVSKITIKNEAEVKVTMVIRENVRKFLKQDAKATIKTEGLMGNKVVSLLPGTTNKPIIKEGYTFETIKPIEIDDILNELDKASRNTTLVTQNLSEITEKINEGKGVFGKLFTDTSFTKNLDHISQNTAKLTHNMSQITKKINKEKGVIGKLLSDTSWAKNFDTTSKSLKESALRLSTITQSFAQEEGVIGKLFLDTTFVSNLSKTSKHLRSLSQNVEDISTKVNTGEGVLNQLLEDSALVDSLRNSLHNINYGAKEIGEASEALRKSWFLRTFGSDQ